MTHPHLTDPDQPPGITTDSDDLPPAVDAAERVQMFVRWFGDGAVFTAEDDYFSNDLAAPDNPPLFARDLEAVAKAAGGLGGPDGLRHELDRELAAKGLPAGAPLSALVDQHRTDAHLAGVMEGMTASPGPATNNRPNPVLADALRYYAERRPMNNPKGWDHVLRVVNQAIDNGVYPNATAAEIDEARATLATIVRYG